MSSHQQQPAQPALEQGTTSQLQEQVKQQQTKIKYRVFRPEIDCVAFDPLDPIKRYHDGVWIEDDPANGKGTFFNVTGDIIAAGGMRYEERKSWIPGQEAPVHKMTPIGYVSRDDMGRVSAVLRALPTPTKQQGINFWQKDPATGRHQMIWTKEDGEPYKSGEEKRSTFKCNEWTALYAIPALKKVDILHDAQ